MRRGLGAGPLGVDGALLAGHHVAMKRVLHPGRRVRLGPQPLLVGLVLGEEQLRRASHANTWSPSSGWVATMAPSDSRRAGFGSGFAQDQVLRNHKRRQHVEPRRLGPAVVDGDAHEDVAWPGFGVLHEHVEVAVLVEGAGVDQLVLEVLARAPAVGLEQVAVRELALRVLVQELHVRVRRRRVDVEVVLLDVLAVVALAVGEPEETFLQDRVALVPERQREAQALLVVADPAQTVFAPAIGAGARLLVTEVIPGVAVGAVVLAHRAPLPLAEVGPPALPRDSLFARVVQTRLFRRLVEAGT